jgi:psiF repeat
MRRFASALAVASLLGCSFAFAQNASPPPGGAAPPAEPPSATPSEGAAQPGTSTGEHATTSAKHMSKKACTKEAKTKQLTGDEKKQFIKDCEHGKTSTE